jgi:hypothetical protein
MVEGCMKKIWITALLLVLSLIFSGFAMADTWKEIKADELKKMMNTEDVLVVFPLSKIEFNDMHIPGSVNIPVGMLKEKLPADKEKKIVFYCLGRK